MWLAASRPDARRFKYPKGLTGFSVHSLQTHLEMYEEIVKDARFSAENIETLKTQDQKSAEILAEMTRQHHRELDSIRLHELYFEILTPGSLTQPGPLFEKRVVQEYQSLAAWKNDFVEKALTRGIGWAVTLYEPETGRIFNRWIEGDEPDPALAKYRSILALDMWEHAYILDYTPGERLRYIGFFLQNINWEVIENRLEEV